MFSSYTWANSFIGIEWYQKTLDVEFPEFSDEIKMLHIEGVNYVNQVDKHQHTIEYMIPLRLQCTGRR